MAIILPYKDYSENQSIKFIAPDGKSIITSDIHEEYACSYLMRGYGNLDLFRSGKNDSFFTNLTSEQCDQLRKWIGEKAKISDITYMYSDFLISKCGYDMVNSSYSTIYQQRKNITTANPLLVERFYNYFLMDEEIDILGIGTVDLEWAQPALEYGASLKFVNAIQLRKNLDLLEELKELKKIEPNKEKRKQYFK